MSITKKVARRLPPDPDRSNKDRTEWAQQAIDAFQVATTADDNEDLLTDLICDLAHWADRNDLSMTTALRRAMMHYQAETSDKGKQFAGVLQA